MTIYDANTKLIDYFKSNDTFRVWEDFKELLIISAEIEGAHAAILGALNGFVELKLVVKSKDKQGNDVFVLVRPLIMQTQFCNLEYGTILRVLETLHKWKELSGNPIQLDPFNITQENIIVLVGLANSGLEKIRKEEE